MMGTSHPIVARAFIRRDSRPTATVHTMIAFAPASRARSMSGDTSGWVLSICAW